jgi:hypothetical protein
MELELSVLHLFRNSDICWSLTFASPVAVVEQSQAWTVFDRSETAIAGSNPALSMDV